MAAALEVAAWRPQLQHDEAAEKKMPRVAEALRGILLGGLSWTMLTRTMLTWAGRWAGPVRVRLGFTFR